MRLFAPSETTAARAQLGSRRFKTDDRDCAALTYLARQGQGRLVPDQVQDALATAVRHRRGLIAEHEVAQQRLHDQLQALCLGLAAPDGHGRALQVDSVIGQAVFDCAAALAGRRPALAACSSPRPGPRPRSAFLERPMARLAATTAGRAGTGGAAGPQHGPLARADRRHRRSRQRDHHPAGRQRRTGAHQQPGVATSRAAAIAAFSLPITRFPSAEHLYSATGLTPGSYRSATINRRTPISRQGLPEHRDALMNLAWGLSQHCGPFIDRHHELRARGLRPIPARIALARHACRLAYTLIQTQQPFDEQRYRRARHQSER